MNARTIATAGVLSLLLCLTDFPAAAQEDSPEVCLSRPKVSVLVPVWADSIPNPRYYNFCFGAILAARDLGNEGIGMDLEIIDTKSQHFLPFWDPSGSDVIIGPVASEDILDLAPKLSDGQYIISPMDQKTIGLTDSLHIILAVTPYSEQVRDMARWIREESFSTDSLITVIEEGNYYSDGCREILDALAGEGIELLDTTQYSIANGLKHDEWFGAHVSEFGPLKRIVTASESEPFQKEVIRAVSVQNFFGKEALLFGTSKTAKVAEMEDLCNAKAHISTTYHIDYSSPEVIRFVLAYRALFHADPDAFSFHGYDTVRFFASLSAMYGPNWPEHLAGHEKTGLQTDFRFIPSAEGYVNSGIRRIVYSSPLTAKIQR